MSDSGLGSRADLGASSRTRLSPLQGGARQLWGGAARPHEAPGSEPRAETVRNPPLQNDREGATESDPGSRSSRRGVQILGCTLGPGRAKRRALRTLPDVGLDTIGRWQACRIAGPDHPGGVAAGGLLSPPLETSSPVTGPSWT